MQTKRYGRNRRVADLIQRELAPLLQKEIDNPDLGLITISAVDVSPDLKNARIFVTSLGGNGDIHLLVQTLNEMAGHYRHELAGSLTLKSMPRLTFEFDESIQRGRHLSELIDTLQSKSGQDNVE